MGALLFSQGFDMKRWLLLPLALSLFTACSNGQKSQLAQCLGFEPSDRVLIVNIDDVGMHPDYDKAAFELIDHKKAQTMSLMVPAPNFALSAKIAAARNLPVGLHLTLTNEWQEKQPWGAVLAQSEVPSLYNKQGYLWASTQEVVEHADINEIEKELRAQIDTALKAGLNVTHIDAHMLVLMQNAELANLFYNLANDYQLAAVYQGFWFNPSKQKSITSKLQQSGYLVPDVYYMQYNPDERRADPAVAERKYRNMVKTLQHGINHLAIHPSYNTPSAAAAMQDMVLRESDFAIWQADKIHQLINQEGVKTASLEGIRELKRQNADCFK